MEFVIVFVLITAMTVAIVGGTYLLTRLMAEPMEALDARLRPQESRTGRCGVCDGTGTRIEHAPSDVGSPVATVACFRCGGSGEPLPPGEIARLPGASAEGYQLRRLIDYVRLCWSLRKVR